MTTWRGYNTIVFIVWGLAIKFPKPHLVKLVKISFKRIKERIFWSLLFRFHHPLDYESIPNCLLGGIVLNFSEYLFYIKTRMQVLQPTYFSLFGLINIQKAGKPLGVNKEKFENWIESLGNGEAENDWHTFGNPENFCLSHDGQIRIVDYSESITHEILLVIGNEMINNFDLASLK